MSSQNLLLALESATSSEDRVEVISAWYHSGGITQFFLPYGALPEGYKWDDPIPSDVAGDIAWFFGVDEGTGLPDIVIFRHDGHVWGDITGDPKTKAELALIALCHPDFFPQMISDAETQDEEDNALFNFVGAVRNCVVAAGRKLKPFEWMFLFVQGLPPLAFEVLGATPQIIEQAKHDAYLAAKHPLEVH